MQTPSAFGLSSIWKESLKGADYGKRQISTTRKTKETDIQVTLNLDGSGISHIETGIGFLIICWRGFSKHGFFDLHMECDGDLQVDSHHTIEDCGIVLGDAIKRHWGQKRNQTIWKLYPSDG